MNLTQYIFLAFLSFTISCCYAQKDIDAFLKEHHQNGKLNGNVLVIKEGKTLYNQSFGYANTTKTEKLTKNHRFNIGSIYKEFPAVAIMQLQEKGMLNTEDKITKYLDNLPKWAQQISITQLLQYSSGLPRVNWGKYFKNNQNITENDLFKDLSAIKELEFQPGTDYIYTNYSPLLLIKIIEQITQLDYTTYLHKHIFEPFGLTSTILNQQYPYLNTPLMAIPFDDNFKQDQYKFNVPYLLMAAKVGDLSQWLQQLHTFKIINKESLRFISKKFEKEGNVQAPLGFCDWQDGVVLEHSHHGSSGNYEGIIRRFPKEKLMIIILTNQKHGNVRDLSNRIHEIVR